MAELLLLSFFVISYSVSIFAKRRIEFANTFRRVFDHDLPQDAEELTILQPWINGVLANCAYAFQRALDDQARISSKASGRSDTVLKNPKELEARLLEFTTARQRVAQQKTEFWETHLLARKAGFSTKKTYKEYLELPAYIHESL